MAIIYRRRDNTQEVLLHIFDKNNFNAGSRITISFHKKIHGAVNFSDSGAISKIRLAEEEISELIY